MTWEEYQNTDFYKESHPDWNRRRSKEELIEEEMRDYLTSVDAYRDEIRKEIYLQENKDDGDGEVDECLYNDILPKDADTENRIVRYICTKLWNGRFRGILRIGTYLECLYARYNYNVACIESEYDWAGIERIEAKDQDELDEILNGYRESVEYYDIYGDDDYDY